MNNQKYPYGICGVYCGQCSAGNGRTNYIAGELLRLTSNLTSDTPDYEIKEFNVSEFRKGLEWFQKSYGCPTCLKIKDPWCEVRKCSQAIDLGSCLLCKSFLDCPHTKYQRDRYPFVVDHYDRVQKVGLEKHLKEEEQRAQEGILLINIRKY